MKKKETSSKYVFILSDIDKTIVRKYNSKDAKWNLSRLSNKEIFDTLKHSNIKHPLLLKKRFRHIDMEYIQGNVLDNTFDQKALSGLICNYIYEFMKIDCSKIKKKIKWKNNTDFFHMLVNQTISNIKKSKCELKLNQLGLSIQSIEKYLSDVLDDQRKLSFIHGNLNRKNIINKNGNFYLINWDEANYGDIAYEIANHLINENYPSETIASIMERISSSNDLNQTNLIHDTSLYIEFEYKLRSIKGIIECINLYKKKKDYNNTLNEIYVIYSIINESITKEQIKEIIEKK